MWLSRSLFKHPFFSEASLSFIPIPWPLHSPVLHLFSYTHHCWESSFKFIFLFPWLSSTMYRIAWFQLSYFLCSIERHDTWLVLSLSLCVYICIYIYISIYIYLGI
jgi:hypothetical protein